jgi:hypothetical protein
MLKYVHGSVGKMKEGKIGGNWEYICKNEAKSLGKCGKKD